MITLPKLTAMAKIRKEVHTRTRFAMVEAEKYFKKIVSAKTVDNGNILTCKNMRKYLQARKIYVHYSREFQAIMGLPLMD